MIVTAAGQNVYPDELERLYADLPHIKELCVLGVSAAGTGEQVHAVVVPDYDGAAGLSRDAVQNAIRQRVHDIAAKLPTHQNILHLHFRDQALPRTSSLKVKRSQLRADLLRGAADHPGAGRGRTPPPASTDTSESVSGLPALPWVQQAIARFIPDAPPPESIGPQALLQMDLGLDSIGQLELIAQVEAHYGVTVSPEVGQSFMRVEDVARFIGDREPLDQPATPRPRDRLEPTPQDTAQTSCPAWWAKPVRWGVRGAVRAALKAYVRFDLHGIENVPRQGPFIVAPNHCSHMDGVAVIAALTGHRRLYIAGAQDYFFKTWLSSFLFRHVFDAIPFDRRAQGIEGLRLCADLLGRGHGLLLFPEGTRSLDGRMQPFKVGLGVLAVETQVPVIPTWLDGTFQVLPKGAKWPQRGVVRVVFGHAQQYHGGNPEGSRYAEYAAFTKRAEQAVRDLARHHGTGRPGAAATADQH
jgi:long-chain acyl-CoA synthetase